MVNSLKTKLIFMVGIPLLVVNFGMLYLSVTEQQHAALKQAEDLSRATTREQSIELQSLIDLAMSASNMTAAVFRNVNDMDNPLDMGRESATLILKGILEKDEDFEGVFSIWEIDAFDMMDVAYGGLPGNSPQGRFSPYWDSTDRQKVALKFFPDSEITGAGGWYNEIRDNPKPILIWNPASGLPGESRPVLRAVAPIINDGVFLGVVGIDMGAGVFETMVASWTKMKPETVIHLHTLDGRLVAPAQSEVTTHCGMFENQSVNPGVLWQDHKLVSARKIESSLALTDLIVVVEVPRDIVLGPMHAKLKKNFGIGLGIVLAALFLVGYFLKVNIARLVKLSVFTRHIALGEKCDPIIDNSKDEVGELYRGFQFMLKSLKDSEDQRLESLTRLETILDSVQAGVVIIDPDNRNIVDANPAALSMLGLPKDQVLNKICHGFICPAETGKCPVLDLNHSVDGDRKILVKSDGSELIIFKTVVPLELQGKTYLLETFVDVDQQVKAEKLLTEKLDQISQAKKQQDILVSHAVSREERMVSLKSEVNDLRRELGMANRYQAPDDIEAWRKGMAKEEQAVHHEIR